MFTYAVKRLHFGGFILSVFAAFYPLIALVSCADDAAVARGAEAVTVFTYNSEDSTPQVRLVVFSEVASDVRRAKSIELTSIDSQYDWTLAKPLIMSGESGGGEKMWAGGVSFVMPSGESFSSGVYEVKYTDANGNEAVSEVIVDGGEDIYALNAVEVDKGEADAVKNVAVYDEKGTLLYYGEEKEDWKGRGGEEALCKDVKGAVKWRRCIVIREGGVVCILPPRYKDKMYSVQNKDTVEAKGGSSIEIEKGGADE